MVSTLLAASLLIVPPAGPERRMVVAALERIARTEEGRRRLEQLRAFRAPVRIVFTSFPGTRLITVDGQKRISGTLGQTRSDPRRPRIALNNLYLKADPAYVRVHLSETIAHELLGHALGALKADQAGVWRAYEDYDDNETSASVVGWVVSAELGDSQDMAYEKLFLRDAAAYRRRRELAAGFYALGLSLPQFSCAPDVLQGRLHWCEQRRKALERSLRQIAAAQQYVAHLLQRRSGSRLAGVTISSGAFAWIRHDLVDRREGLVYNLRRNSEVKSALRRRLAYYAGTSGREALRRERESLLSERGQRFFQEENVRIERLKEHLAATAVFAPSHGKTVPAGQVSWKQLRRIYDDEAAQNPEIISERFWDPAGIDWSDWMESDWGREPEQH